MYVLSFGELIVGQIKDPFCSDDTWHGTLECQLQAGDGPHARRVLDFIAFCEDWNERVERDEPTAGNPAEFDAFSDVVDSGLWEVRTETGARHRL
jgi:hypothetical protein